MGQNITLKAGHSVDERQDADDENKTNEEQKDEFRKTFFLQEPHFMSGSATQKVSTWESLSLTDTGSVLRSCFCAAPCLNPFY